jgi:hypothetical protein
MGTVERAVHDGSDDLAAGGPARTIVARLQDPLAHLTFEQLQRHWRHLRIRIETQRPHDFDDGTTLPARVRGALGWALLDLVQHPDWLALERSPAHAVFFRETGAYGAGRRIPKPLALSAEVRGDRLIVTLTVFGFAIYWASEVAEALIKALATGITLYNGAMVRARVAPLAVVTDERRTVAPLSDGNLATLIFRTPVAVRRRNVLVADGPAILTSLAERVAGLARWQDLDATPDWARLKAAIRRLRFDTRLHRLAAFDRYSSRQPGRRIRMTGSMGAIDLSGDLEPILPLLALGETCHTGSHAAFGFGRFEVAGPRMEEHGP